MMPQTPSSITAINKRIYWIIFACLSLISVAIWHQFSYSQLAFIDLAVNREQARSAAREYLLERDRDLTGYRTAAVFGVDRETDRYLQKTLGFRESLAFIKRYDLDMFYWVVRFFKEHQKEQYVVKVSSSSGEIISLQHTIEDSIAKPSVDRPRAKAIARDFFERNLGLDLKDYKLSGDLKTVFDNRDDFTFIWQNTDVAIPWSEEEDTGTAKLTSSVVISGQEVRSFTKNNFRIPDQFSRELSRQITVGGNISTVVRIFYITLLTAAIFFVLSRRNHLAMHTTKKFYIGIALISFALSVATIFNQFQQILYQYDTTSDFDAYLARFVINLVTTALFVTMAILMPSLAGELLHFETLKNKPRGAFLHYVLSTFASRKVAAEIVLGYLVCSIMLGIQSVMIKFGQDHLGVWVEYRWITQLTTAYLPFLAAFALGYKASVSEELMYRLFAISWGKKLLKNTVAAAVVASLIWGFAHSGYTVFPMWFRGVEVTCLGLFLSYVYLRFGIIPVLVGHYLFDVFWNTTGYLLGDTQPFYFYSSLGVLLLPLVWATVAFVINKREEMKPMRWHLNSRQRFNLEILTTYLRKNGERFQGKSKEEITADLARHGWDVAVIDVALEDMPGNSGQGTNLT